jgi:hypothetical protein
MNQLNPWRLGAALALTAAVLYTACALAFALWPDATVRFFNTWLHGLDLRPLQATAKAVTAGAFAYGLAGIALTAFATGALFGLFANRLHIREQPKRRR